MIISRREMLRTAALAGAGTVAAPAMAAGLCEKPQHWDRTFDAIVVGSGGAGLTAAIVAKENGLKDVVVVEKLAFPGGNTNVSGGGFNAAVEADAKAINVEDSPALHAEQTLAAGDFRADPELVRTMTENAPASVQWLKDHGLVFQKTIYQIYGGLWPRCRNPEGEKGFGYIKVELAACKKLGIPIEVKHKVVAFIREEPDAGRVLGVKVETPAGVRYWRAKKGVIAAAGGFAANAAMCALFDPRLPTLNTTNQPGSTGEVLVAMQDIGALATGLDYIQCIPGAAPGLKKSLNLHQAVEYTLFVNKEGQRFVAEDSRRDIICNAVLKQTDKFVFEIADSDGLAANNQFAKTRNDACLKNGLMFEAQTLEELAEKLHIPPKAFVETVRAYNASCETGKDAFGRAARMMKHPLKKAPFYGGPFGMSRHHTMGGVRITPRCEVLDRSAQVIPGLYAAGEVTGGIHGTNRIGGNAICDVFTFGRLAGLSVAKA